MELRVHPIERRLHVERGANLLDELRRYAVPVSYSCEAGRCGLCHCEVLEGEVLHQGHELRHPAMHLERPGCVLACQTVLTEDCTIRLPEPEEVIVHPAQTLRAVIASIDELSSAVKRLRLKAARPFSFSAGQYAMLHFAPGLARPYSMAGLPGELELEFHVALTPGGRATSYVAKNFRPGDAVRVTGPLGTSFLRRNDRGPVLCVAAGTGLAPVLSIVREAVRAKMPNAIHVYLGARSSAELYGVDILQAITSQQRNVRANIVTLGGNRPAGVRSGPVTDAIAADQRDLSDWQGYLFGVPSAVEAATILAKQLGMRADRLHADAFYSSGM